MKTPRAPTKPNTRKPLGSTTLLLHIDTHTHKLYPKTGKILRKIGRGGFATWAEEAIQSPSRAIRAGVTRGELGGEPQASPLSSSSSQSSSSSLEATSGGSSSGQEPSEVARDCRNSSSSRQDASSANLISLLVLAGSKGNRAPRGLVCRSSCPSRVRP